MQNENERTVIKDVDVATKWVESGTKDWVQSERNAVIRGLLIDAFLAGMRSIGPGSIGPGKQ